MGQARFLSSAVVSTMIRAISVSLGCSSSSRLRFACHRGGNGVFGFWPQGSRQVRVSAAPRAAAARRGVFPGLPGRYALRMLIVSEQSEHTGIGLPVPDTCFACCWCAQVATNLSCPYFLLIVWSEGAAAWAASYTPAVAAHLLHLPAALQGAAVLPVAAASFVAYYGTTAPASGS